MATYQARIWGEDGSYEATCQANTPFVAKTVLANSHGVSESDVDFPFEVHEETTNSSSQSNNNSYSSGSVQLPSLKSLLVGGVVLYGLSLFGGNVTQLKEMVPNTQQMEYTQQNNTPTSNPFDNVTTYSNHHIDDTIPEFFNTEVQEEAITDLGQDWDN